MSGGFDALLLVDFGGRVVNKTSICFHLFSSAFICVSYEPRIQRILWWVRSATIL